MPDVPYWCSTVSRLCSDGLILRKIGNLEKGIAIAIYVNMVSRAKKILIVDERGFSRICSAIVEECVGYQTEVASHAGDLPAKMNSRDLGLIVTSYPFGEFLFNAIRERHVPAIILSDDIDKNLLNMLDVYDKAYCMIKPVDYEKFKTLIKQVVNGDPVDRGVCGIV